jgi:hypothetical protein
VHDFDSSRAAARRHRSAAAPATRTAEPARVTSRNCNRGDRRAWSAKRNSVVASERARFAEVGAVPESRSQKRARWHHNGSARSCADIVFSCQSLRHEAHEVDIAQPSRPCRRSGHPYSRRSSSPRPTATHRKWFCDRHAVYRVLKVRGRAHIERAGGHDNQFPAFRIRPSPHNRKHAEAPFWRALLS